MKSNVVYLGWRCNELLMATDQGLRLWTSTYHPRQHVFEIVKDNSLWEWGF